MGAGKGKSRRVSGSAAAAATPEDLYRDLVDATGNFLQKFEAYKREGLKNAAPQAPWETTLRQEQELERAWTAVESEWTAVSEAIGAEKPILFEALYRKISDFLLIRTMTRDQIKRGRDAKRDLGDHESVWDDKQALESLKARCDLKVSSMRYVHQKVREEEKAALLELEMGKIDRVIF